MCNSTFSIEKNSKGETWLVEVMKSKMHNEKSLLKTTNIQLDSEWLLVSFLKTVLVNVNAGVKQ